MPVIKKIYLIPIYPFLLTLYWPFQFFFNNSTLFEIIQPTLLFVVLAVFISTGLVVFWGFYKDIHKAAVAITTLFVLLIIFKISFSVLTIFFVFLLVLIFLMKWFPVSEKLTLMCNIFVSFMLIFLILIQIEKTRTHSDLTNSSDILSIAGNYLNHYLDTKPSILHIILDGYASNSVLQNVYEFDNSAFLKYLENKGFIVFNSARSPYNQTLPVMSAMSLGRYWKPDEVDLENDEAKRRYWGKVATIGPHYQILRKNGYHFGFTENGYSYINQPKNAQHSEAGSSMGKLFDFASNFLSTTSLYHLVAPHLMEISLKNHLKIITNAFSGSFIHDLNKPFYIYQHVLSPHPPFIFDDQGNFSLEYQYFSTIADGDHATGGDPLLIEHYKDGYLNKLKMTNTFLMRQIDKTIPKTKELIIIIHGDHGGGAHLRQDSVEYTCLAERFSPFLAIYSSSDTISNLIEKNKNEVFNLIDVFPILYSAFNGKEYSLTKNQNWFIPWTNTNQHLVVNIDEELWMDSSHNCD